MKNFIVVCFLVVLGVGPPALATTTSQIWYFDNDVQTYTVPDVVENADWIEPATLYVTPGPGGGWSNGADNWSYYALKWPLVGGPLLVRLERGRHTLRLENTSGGGVNLDYIVLAPVGMEVTREAVER